MGVASAATADEISARQTWCQAVESGGRRICEWKPCVNTSDVIPGVTPESEKCTYHDLAEDGATLPSLCTLKPQTESYIAEVKENAGCPVKSALGTPDCPCLGTNYQTPDEQGFIFADMLNRSFEQQEVKSGTPWYLLQPDQMDKYDSDYGATCGMHNEPGAGPCYDLFPPDWCFKSWCYVDPCNCKGVKFANSTGYFLSPALDPDRLDSKFANPAWGGTAPATAADWPGHTTKTTLYYSYETCGDIDDFSNEGIVDGADD